ncbi:MAG: hypothetical protein LBT20_01195 [Clostridiales bacterium]|nr:hypothetical protein [Clostridiales bacterium]
MPLIVPYPIVGDDAFIVPYPTSSGFARLPTFNHPVRLRLPPLPIGEFYAVPTQ